MSNIELTSKVHELRELRRMAAELDQAITELQDSIKNHMEAQGVDEITGTDWRCTYKAVTATRFDKRAMIQTFGQSCYDGFCKVTTSRRFTLA